MSGQDYLKLIQWVPKLWRYRSTWKFKRIFGKDAGKEYHIIYKMNKVPDRRIVFQRYEPKLKRECYGSTTNLTTITSCATTRAIGYLVYAFGEKVNKPPFISSHADTDEKMNISFISIGGRTNLKTCDLLKEVPDFLTFEGDSILHRKSKLVTASEDTDCGVIIKIHPQNNHERTWLCCAGVGEWGTSGAAWFLSRKWKDIHKWAKSKSFAIVTRTNTGSDETTQLFRKFLRFSKTDEFTILS